MKGVWPAFAVVVALGTAGCRPGAEPGHQAPGAEEGWAVTAWGERYEVFAETDPLIAGRMAVSNAHVTLLDGFAPLRRGTVALVLRGPGGEQVFQQTAPVREGIFAVEARPDTDGEFEMLFRIDGPSGAEEIAAGRVRVGTAVAPGGAIGNEESGDPGAISFLKEQQWRTEFATSRVAEGALRESVAGPGRVTPSAGGEVTLTATIAAAVAPEPWPYPGLEVTRGGSVLRLLPRAGERSFPDLQADAASLEAEVETARRRVDRLAELLRLEATSPAELERARSALAGLEARLRAARQGMSAATATDTSSSGAAITIVAPWSGRVAEVSVSPGQTVAAGAPLARLVKVRPLWIVLALRPEDAARVRGRPSGLLLRRPASEEVVEVAPADLRLVSRSPEVDPETATIGLIVEVDRTASELPIGAAVEAELLLAGEKRGIVVPASALIDDAGVMVAYVQLGGESFARREVRVVMRQGARALVTGLDAGERLVTRGGGAIRRSALLSTGPPEGHVH